jgi:hypothetical protein
MVLPSRKVWSAVKKIVAITVIVILVVVFGVLCYLMVEGTIIGAWDIPQKIHWQEKTKPLDSAVVKDLCSVFSLPASDPKCKSGSVVYAPDFFGVIRDAFQPDNGNWATYDEVQEKLGKYQYRYEPPVTESTGLTYFVSGYDLQGDRVYPIGMFFYSDGRLWRLVADVGD